MKEFNELDEMFREGLQNARISPPPGVWEAVSSSTAAGTSGAGSSLLIAGKWIAATLAVGAIGVTAWYMSTGDAPISEKPLVKSPVQTENSVQSSGESGNSVNSEEQTGQSGTIGKTDDNQINTGSGNIAEDGTPQANLNEHQEQPTTEILKPITTGDKPVITTRQKDPGTTGSNAVAINCNSGLSIQAEKVSNTAYSFVAIKPQGLVTWYFNDGVVGSGYQTSHNFPEIPGIYQVKVVTSSIAGSCRDSAVYRVVVAGPKPDLKNFFSPNGDGFNDAYYVEISHTLKFEMVITDAQNRVVFSTTDPNAKWDGTCRSVLCPEGNYQVTLSYMYPGETKVNVLREVLRLTRDNN